MRRRNQDPKDETEQVHEVVPVITFAFVSVRLADSEGSNILARLAAAAYSPFEQQELWKQAELFFQKEMGCLGRVIKVQGDLQPAASYLILAPGVKLLPEVLVAAKKFMTTCTSFKTLKVQLQLGRSAVMDDTGLRYISPSPFFNAQWRQHRNGTVCTQLFAGLTPKHAAVYAVISRADFSAEAQKLSLLSGPDLQQVLAQVECNLGADNELSLDDCTAGCTMVVPPDGMVFMVLLAVPAAADGRILYNLVT